MIIIVEVVRYFKFHMLNDSKYKLTHSIIKKLFLSLINPINFISTKKTIFIQFGSFWSSHKGFFFTKHLLDQFVLYSKSIEVTHWLAFLVTDYHS